MDFEAVVLMSKRNNLHSFTLWPKSSAIVEGIKSGKKSQFVSKAIAWYSGEREFIIKEYTYESTLEGVEGLTPGTRTYERNIRLLDLSELVEANEQLQERFAEVCIELREMKKSRSFIWKIRNLFKK